MASTVPKDPSSIWLMIGGSMDLTRYIDPKSLQRIPSDRMAGVTSVCGIQA